MRFILLVLLLKTLFISAQIVENDNNKPISDTIVVDKGDNDSIKIFKPTLADYKKFYQWQNASPIDTSFNIQRYHQFTEYTNKDSFGMIPFTNIGSGYNPMLYEIDDKQDLTLVPSRKGFILTDIDEVNYYDVKTPTTIFNFHSGVRNGGALRTTYAQNIGKEFNFSLTYDGLRSEGKYQRALASNNTTLFTGHYKKKNNR